MKCFLALIVLLTVSIALPASAGEVKLQVANGRVTLQARDATVREILAEWGRVGQVKIINGEKISGVPVTLELRDVPEAQALGTLLRSVSGYIAAPKLQPAVAASIYDRIVIMAAPRSLAASVAYPAPPLQQPQYRPGMPPGMANPGMLDDPDDQPGAAYPGGPPVYRGGFVPGQQPGAPGGPPPVTGGVPQGAPGTISPIPQMQVVPGQPVVQPATGAPGTVTPPVRKPGGPGGTGPGGEGGH